MKVLFVVTAFYPEQAIGSIRITKFAKYMQEQGMSVSVISLKPPPWAVRDETLWFDGMDRIQWYTVDHSTLFKKIFQQARVATIGTGAANSGTSAWSARPTFKNRIRNTAQLGYTLIKAIDWSVRVCKHAEEYIPGQSFDFIFCSYPSFGSPLTGMQLKKLGFGKNLAVDFRDPIATSKSVRFSLLRWLQNYIMRTADLRFYVSDGVREQMAGSGAAIWDHVACNGFDPEDTSALRPTAVTGSWEKVLRFVYTGAMYGGRRDLRPFFQAIATVLAQTGYRSDSLSIEYAGNESEIFRSQAEEFGLEERVVDHGRLSRSGALALQQYSDVCLLATWNSSSEQGVLTGKVFEYFSMKKPIVAIVGGDLLGSEISRVIRKIGAGHCFEAAEKGSISKLEDWLESALEEKQATGTIQNRYNEMVIDFHIREIVVGISEKMNKLVETNGE